MRQAFKDKEISHQKFLDTTEFAPLIIYINDTLYDTVESPFKNLSKDQKEKFFTSSEAISNESFKINLSNIKIDSSQYILRYKSSIKSSIQDLMFSEFSKEKHMRRYGGTIGLSRIKFNKDLSEGIFWFSFYCGKLCGCDFTIFIKKEYDRWIIEKITNNRCG